MSKTFSRRFQLPVCKFNVQYTPHNSKSEISNSWLIGTFDNPNFGEKVKIVPFAKSYTISFIVIKTVKNKVFCITLCQPCSKATFFASYLLQKYCINTGATTKLIVSTHTLYLFLLYLIKVQLRERFWSMGFVKRVGINECSN